MGRIEVVLGPARRVRRSASASAGRSASRTSRYAGRTPLDLDAIASRRSSRDLGDRTCDELPRLGAPRRQALSDDVAADRARGRRPHQGGARLARQSRRARAHDPRRAADRRRVLLLRQGTRAGRPADRHGRSRGVPAVGRHRFAGGRAPHDEARLRGDLRALPQLSDPVARVAGEGARAGAAADEVAAALAAVSRARSARSSSRSCSRCPARCASWSTAG